MILFLQNHQLLSLLDLDPHDYLGIDVRQKSMMEEQVVGLIHPEH
jgi:hypothetical protein